MLEHGNENKRKTTQHRRSINSSSKLGRPQPTTLGYGNTEPGSAEPQLGTKDLKALLPPFYAPPARKPSLTKNWLTVTEENCLCLSTCGVDSHR